MRNDCVIHRVNDCVRWLHDCLCYPHGGAELYQNFSFIIVYDLKSCDQFFSFSSCFHYNNKIEPHCP
jgi:hypothetical protein